MTLVLVVVERNIKGAVGNKEVVSDSKDSWDNSDRVSSLQGIL